MLTRRRFLKAVAAVGAVLAVPWSYLTRTPAARAGAAAPTAPAVPLDPVSVTKYAAPLIIPPAMPKTSVLGGQSPIDYYEIAVRQFSQQILPPGQPETTVWSYGSAKHPGTFNYPSFTVEATWQAPVRVKWINDLVDPSGHYLPHLLPVDQTLHWANPPGGDAGRDGHGMSQEPYAGPVPIITHVHGAHAPAWADGYPEAWYLPAATDIPAGYATVGSWYETNQAMSGLAWQPGSATFDYPNDQRAATLWYHDHSLGMTRANVYAGPAGFFLLRGGPDDEVTDARSGGPAILPGPAPALDDEPGTTYFEIPIAIQDRSFNADGSLFYPDNRAFFEGLRDADDEGGDETLPLLSIPFTPDVACDDETSDVAPIWNPEFFGNTIVVNGRTWPYLDVQRRRYRLRLLNGCDSRFLVLAFDNPAVHVWLIGTEGGFLPKPLDMRRANRGRILLGPAERADVIVDFGAVPAGASVRLLNLGPDEPFGGGEPDEAFERADPATTGQVMEFRATKTVGPDPTTPPRFLRLPAIAPSPASSVTRPLSLNEEVSKTVRVVIDDEGNVVLACDDLDAEAFGPVAALLGTLDPDGNALPMSWMMPTTDNPQLGATETWEFFNFTADAHPIHIHEVQFRVVDRQALATDEEGMSVQPATLVGTSRAPEAWESGFKDTVIAYPGEVTRVQATFDLAGRYVWHCHILEHEDNEMMRPYDVVG